MWEDTDFDPAVMETTEAFWCQGSTFFPLPFFDKGYLMLLPKYMHHVLHSTDKSILQLHPKIKAKYANFMLCYTN